MNESLQFALAFVLSVSPIALGLHIGYRMGKSRDQLYEFQQDTEESKTQELIALKIIALDARPNIVTTTNDALFTLQKENLELKKELAGKEPLFAASIKLGQARKLFAETKSDPAQNGITGKAQWDAEQNFQRVLNDQLQ